MNKPLLTATLCLSLASAFGQTVWCPAGAQWHYGYGSFNVSGYIELNYVGDTVYNGAPCHRLDQRIKYIIHPDNTVSENHHPVYTYESGGIVYAAVPTLSDWDTLINFNAAPNNVWGMFPDNGFNVSVEDTGHRLIQGYNLKYLAVTFPNNNGFDYHDTIYERIGYAGVMYPFDMQLNTDPDTHDFCNYSDDAFADWSHPDSMCTFLPTGIFELNDAKPLSLSPNPSQGVVKLDGLTAANAYTITVSTPAGKRIRYFDKPKATLDLSDLPNGIYFLSADSHQGVYRGTLVISK